MDIGLALAADYASIDANGKLSVMGIFQELNPPSLPFIVPQIYLVVTYVLEPAELDREFPNRIDWVTPRLDRTLIREGPLFIPPEGIRRRDRPGIISQITGLAGAPIDVDGEHRFVVNVDDGPRREVPIFVNRPH